MQRKLILVFSTSQTEFQQKLNEAIENGFEPIYETFKVTTAETRVSTGGINTKGFFAQTNIAQNQEALFCMLLVQNKCLNQ